MRRSFWFSILLIGLVAPHAVAAGCKSECLQTYQSEKEDCVLMHDDPDEADELRMCLEDAKATYDDCIEECES